MPPISSKASGVTIPKTPVLASARLTLVIDSEEYTGAFGRHEVAIALAAWSLMVNWDGELVTLKEREQYNISDKEPTCP